MGEDYEPALMITRVTTAVASRLAAAPLLPLDPTAYGPETRRQLLALTTRAYEVGALQPSGGPKPEIAASFSRLQAAADELWR